MTTLSEYTPNNQRKNRVNFTTGLDIRFLDDEKAKLLKKMHISQPRFAWDEHS